MTVADTWRPSLSTQRNTIRKPEEISNVRNAEADAQNHWSGSPPRHVRRHGRRQACRVRGTERDHRHTGRTRTSHPASPQRPKLQPNQDVRRRRGGNRQFPMRRKEHLADLSPVLRRSQPGTLAPPRVAHHARAHHSLRAWPAPLPARKREPEEGELRVLVKSA